MSLRDIKKLRLGGRTYSVDFRNELPDNILGRVNVSKCSIEIKKNAPDEEADTLLHEVLHACFAAGCIDLTQLQEENIIERLTPWLHAFLSQNPAIVNRIAKIGSK